MIWVCIGEALVIVALAGACVAIALTAIARITALEQLARAERYELHERIRMPDQRPVAVPRPRRRGEDREAKPKDLGALARVGTVAPLRDSENGVV